jgi:hypothetical protein
MISENILLQWNFIFSQDGDVLSCDAVQTYVDNVSEKYTASIFRTDYIVNLFQCLFLEVQ